MVVPSKCSALGLQTLGYNPKAIEEIKSISNTLR